MQATVQDFDPDTACGHVVLDDGRPLSFGRAAFAQSGLRLLRTGQRVRLRVQTSPDGVLTIAAVTIATLPFRDE